MNVNFEYYKIFYYVAKYRNFTKAAQALENSQPNITRAMNSLVYELVYPYSVKVVVQQGYLDKLMHFQSQNPHTMEQFAQLRQMMDSYIAGRLQGKKTEEKKK